MSKPFESLRRRCNYVTSPQLLNMNLPCPTSRKSVHPRISIQSLCLQVLFSYIPMLKIILGGFQLPSFPYLPLAETSPRPSSFGRQMKLKSDRPGVVNPFVCVLTSVTTVRQVNEKANK